MVAFNRAAPHRLDVEEFLESVREAPSNPDLTRVRAAMDLYRGDLLAGFSVRGAPAFDEWLVTHREHVRQVALNGLRSLAGTCAAHHEYAQATAVLSRLLDLDPWAEDAHRELMRLLVDNGQRTAALAQYATLQRVLADDLGTEPEAGTVELAEAIRTGRVGTVSTRRAGSSSDKASRAVARHTNLPAQVSSFVGRETELAELRRDLPMTRLLTLTGPGGCGKTRLAPEFAGALVEHVPAPTSGPAASARGTGSGGPGSMALLTDGVWLVELAGLVDPGLVPQAVAAALSVREASGGSLLATLADALRDRRMLLILDNCEHLRAACAALTDRLLRACLGVRVLATSRHALGLTGEVVRLVPPLEAPPQETPPEALINYAAARLFLERAAAVAPGLAVTAQTAVAVTRVCHQLDGLPLALELAAARVPGIGFQHLAARLDQLRMLTGGSPAAAPRQRTLRATIAWSHDLLTAAEAVLFRRLAVFAGGWTRDAAEAVCADDGDAAHVTLDDPAHVGSIVLRRDEIVPLLLDLVDQSLVVADMRPDGLARYRLLETLREYALERLVTSGDPEATRCRHAAFYLRLAEAAATRLNSGPELGASIDRLEIERDNLLGALRWIVERGDAERGWRLGDPLATLSIWRGYAGAARMQLAPLIALPRTGCSRSTELKALEAEAELAFHHADYALAVTRHTDRLALCRLSGDRESIVAALNDLGHALREHGDYAGASERLEESLAIARGLGDKHRIAVALDLLGTVAHARGHAAEARAHYEDSIAIARTIGDQLLLAWTPFNLGCLALDQGNLSDARARMIESLTVWRARRATDGIVHGLAMLASLAAAEGQALEAIRLGGATLALSESSSCPLAPFYRRRFERWLGVAHQATNPESAAAAWAEGRALTRAQALTAALGHD